ncbi:hypothetical protein TELCIR_17587 [Teladorsagia circumcincta]|uniref:Neurotransmitter-gated ion-channel transmembrane domain-containing protein n=1 Tax=Teladorsagia circumcincta TaxID=45464 RepID=A0A2G9TSD3_TELCI|nr:hypothetical protein TELCIR_17587 [Teladorsagia circumcincta]
MAQPETNMFTFTAITLEKFDTKVRKEKNKAWTGEIRSLIMLAGERWFLQLERDADPDNDAKAAIEVWLRVTRDDWKYVAMVIDRLLLLLFFGITLGGTLGIICSAPHVFDFVDQELVIRQLNAKYMNSTEELLTTPATF